MYDLNDIKNTKGMHIAHLNVRSLVNKWDNIKANFLDSGIHVLSISESWLHELLPDNLFCLSNNYVLIRNDRSWNDAHNSSLPPKKGGGICMYVSNKLDFSDTNFAHLNSSNKDLESQWVSVAQKPNKTILLGNLYRPPQGDIQFFFDMIENKLEDVDLQWTEVILMGDINIDLLDKQNNAGKELLDLMKQLGLRQLIRDPTQYSQHKNSCIDLFFTNSDIIANSGVCNVNISDHQMILLTRKKIKLHKQKCSFIGRSYRNYNKEIFQERLTQADWTFLQNDLTVQEQWDKWLNNIHDILNVMCPSKTFKISQIKQPWITPRLIELIKDKDKVLKNAKKHKDKPELWVEAKRFRNACTNRLRKARADYIKDQLVTHSNNQKKFWNHIQNVLPTTGNNKKIISLLDNDKNNVEPEDTADFINNFFINIGPNLAKKCNLEWEYIGPTSDGSISEISTTPDEIMNICKSININKASCVDNVASEILRDAFLAVPDKLCLLFNNCFTNAIIPTTWKCARVTPLPKSGNSQTVSNYRPISLLPLLSKLIEKIVHRRLYDYLMEFDLLDKRQGGFRPEHSIVKTCAYFTEDLYQAINNNEITIAVYIDAMKAFDTVNHQILIKKMQKIGIQGNFLGWVKNYLSDRKQCTIANDIVSDVHNITCGVPQGSVLGPLLFILYINDITNSVVNSKVSMYADDTVLYISHKKVETAITLIQSDLNGLYTWCNRNKLYINCKKTKYCLYGMRSSVKKSKMRDIQLSLNTYILERVCSYKYLGLILDEHLNYNKQIKEMNKLVSHKLYLLSKVRKYLTTAACINIFKTMVLSLIEYCDIVYAGTSATNLTKVDGLFYRGLRICLDSKNRMSRKLLCTECKVAPLEDRRCAHLLLFVHKQLENKQLLKKKVVNTRLQTGPVFNTYKPSNEKAKSSVFYRGAIKWNEITAKKRNLSFKDFKLYQNDTLKLCYNT